MTHLLRVAAVCLAIAAATCACRSKSDDAASGAIGTLAARVDAGDRPRACSPGSPCLAGEYCAYDPQICGKGAHPGTCRPIPTGCTGQAPVCGCDGNVYPNECAAHAARVDLDTAGGCPADVPDYIHCGPRFCNAHDQYCEIYISDVVDPPTDYECKPLPPSCVPRGGAARTCDCFPVGTPCLSFCGPMPTGGLHGLHLTCQGKKKPSL